MATLKTSFLIDLLLRLGFEDAESYPPELLADIKSKLSSKYQKEIEEGELDDAVSYISNTTQLQDNNDRGDTESQLSDLSISSEESQSSLLQFTSSKMYKRNDIKSTADYQNAGLVDDNTTRELVSKIQDLDLSSLQQKVENQKKEANRREMNDDEYSRRDEDDDSSRQDEKENDEELWTASKLYDSNLYEVKDEDESYIEEEEEEHRTDQTNRGCKLNLFPPSRYPKAKIRTDVSQARPRSLIPRPQHSMCVTQKS
jgi:hypothetical protein